MLGRLLTSAKLDLLGNQPPRLGGPGLLFQAKKNLDKIPILDPQIPGELSC